MCKIDQNQNNLYLKAELLEMYYTFIICYYRNVIHKYKMIT